MANTKTIRTNLSVNSALDAASAAISGNATVGGTLTTTGNAVFNADASVAGDLTVTGNLVSSALAFDVELSGDTAIAANTAIAWDTELYDDDAVIAAGIFTVPTGKAGKYLFTGFFSTTVGNTVLTVYVNNALYRRASYIVVNQGVSYSCILDLAAGDTVDLRTEDAVTIAGAGTDGSNFQGIKLG